MCDELAICAGCHVIQVIDCFAVIARLRNVSHLLQLLSSSHGVKSKIHSGLMDDPCTTTNQHGYVWVHFPMIRILV